MGYEQINGARDMIQRQKTELAQLNERATPRFTLLIRTAKLNCDQAEYLCVIRDVSAEGVSVRLFHPLPIETKDAQLVLEMQAGDCYPVTLVWQNPGEAGFRFVTPVDVEQVIRRSGRFPKRELRFAAELPVDLLAAAQRYDAVLQNISQQGAMIETGNRLAIAQTIRIESPGLPKIEAKVRWRLGERYGLIFDTTFRMHDLAEIVQSLQKRRQVSVPPAVPGQAPDR